MTFELQQWHGAVDTTEGIGSRQYCCCYLDSPDVFTDGRALSKQENTDVWGVICMLPCCAAICTKIQVKSMIQMASNKHQLGGLQ